MSEFRFPELENDADEISRFVDRENTRTRLDLCDAEFEADRKAALAILEAEDDIGGVTRRGEWYFTFRQSQSAPRGQWLCLPEDESPSADANWQVVFDLDAFCKQTEEVWHWRGARTAWFDPTRVLLCLSLRGSDQVRFIEFDIATRSIVEGGFDLPPARASATWRDKDRVLWASAAGENAATESSWARVVRVLRRKDQPETGTITFEIGHGDLVVEPYILRDKVGAVIEAFSRFLAIGQEEAVLRFEDGREVTLDAPNDTQLRFNHSHYAYVVQGQGGPSGALVLRRIDGSGTRVLFQPAAGRSVDFYSVLLLHDWMLWQERDGLAPRLMVLDLRDENAQPVELKIPDKGAEFHVTTLDAAPEPGQETLLLWTRGFLSPPQVIQFDLIAGPENVRWKKLIGLKPRFDTSGMTVEVLQARSEDGTMVPYHLVRPEGATGDLPVLIGGYGGFGMSMRPWYNPTLGKLWLEKGGAYVMAHIRGGAELGPNWHLQAKGPGRVNAFADFAAIADDLVQRGLSRPEKIACHGGSNGGLLCGVMLTRYPEKFGAVWASVGVFDMMRFHLFPAGRAWMDEYGDPEREEDRQWLLNYSPIHRAVSDGERPYPPWFIDTNSHDDRVDPSHARRMAARLLELGHEGWFCEYGDGGHGGGGASEAAAEEAAMGYAFLRHALNFDVK